MSHSVAPSSPFVSQIRDQIQRDVVRLKREIGLSVGQVKLGYFVNTHRGYPIYRDGDVIDGTPVTIDRTRFHAITVVAASRAEVYHSTSW